MDIAVIKRIQVEVGEWSQQNFGDQESKHAPGTVLAELCPLMGLFEEFGELVAAKTEQEGLDAVADILVYCCDFAYRDGFSLEQVLTSVDAARRKHDDAVLHITVALGQLAHCCLKRHQGIRGYDVAEKYETERNLCIAKIFAHLGAYVAEHHPQYTLTSILESVWQGEVVKRDWAADPKSGSTDDAPPVVADEEKPPARKRRTKKKTTKKS